MPNFFFRVLKLHVLENGKQGENWQPTLAFHIKESVSYTMNNIKSQTISEKLGS